VTGWGGVRRAVAPVLVALIGGLLLAACDRPDPERIRICRSLVDAVARDARDLRELPPDAAREAGYDVKIAFRARDDGNGEREGWIACRFVRDKAGAPLRLVAVATDRTGPLDESALFWLDEWREIVASESVDARLARKFAVEVAHPKAGDPWLPALYFAQQLVNAAALAGVYALLALSFTLVYGIVAKINFAFGELYMMGAVLSGVWVAALATVGVAGWAASLTLVLGVCLVTVAAHGWTMERIAFRPLRETKGYAAKGHAPLIVAIGLSITLQEAVRLLQGARDVWIPADYGLSFTLAETYGFNVVASWKQVGIIVLTALVLFGLAVAFRRTRFGLSYRACADDGPAAALLGVDVARTVAGTFALGGALAGLAGFALLQYYGVANFFMGFVTGFKALTAAILGGIGSLPGAVLGGVLIALFETFWSAYLGGEYRDVAVFGVLALVLVFRPGGLLGVETERIAQPDRS
jgi:branched-chain amino acid transport system permease protein